MLNIKRIILVNSRPEDGEFVTPFIDEVKKHGKEVQLVNTRDLNFFYNRVSLEIKVFSGNEEIKFIPGDYVYLRRSWKAKTIGNLLAYVCKVLEVPINDSEARLKSDLSNTKLVQAFSLSKIISSPTTWVGGNLGYHQNQDFIVKNFSLPLVLKINGANGDKVWKIRTLEELDSKVSDIWDNDNEKLVLIQELIPNTYDIRAIVYKDQILSVIKRSAVAGNFHNNISKNGTASSTELSVKEIDLALKVTKELGLDLGGVDLVRIKDETLLLEVNMSPGLVNSVVDDYNVRTLVKRLLEV